MNKIKKISLTLVVLLMMVCVVPLLTACFGPDNEYTTLMVNYTQNLKFLVGEDYEDPLLKGTAKKRDGSKEDVTKEMEVDISYFNKNQVGKYEIVCKFEGIEASYEVEVVAELTDKAIIAQRLEKVSNETFKRNEGVLSYEASNTQVLFADPQDTESSYVFNENLIYVDNNGQLSIYLSWSFDQEKVVEYWYEGTLENAILTLKAGDELIDVYSNIDFDTFILILSSTAEVIELDIHVMPTFSEFDAYEFLSEASSASLTRNIDGVYSATVSYGVGENLMMEYRDNIVTNVDGVNYTFPKPSTSIIPEIPAI